MMEYERNEKAGKGVPIDLDIARTPKTRCPFHCMTLPPLASIRAYSSSRLGYKTREYGSLGHFTRTSPPKKVDKCTL